MRWSEWLRRLIRGAAPRMAGERSGRAAHGRRDPLGPAGERAAAKHLRRAGYRIVGTNVRLAMGEIDLLALDPERLTLVVVEVKARRLEGGVGAASIRGSAPPPEASVTDAKRRRLLALAAAVSSMRRWRGRGVRIDVVGVDWAPDRPPIVRHHVNAVVR